jgi:hypothetical protein
VSFKTTFLVVSAPFVFNDHNDEKGHWGEDHYYIYVWELYSKAVFSWQPTPLY